MAVPRFIADPHLGHRNIWKYRPVFESTLHNDLYFTRILQECSTKRDSMYFLGDVILGQKVYMEAYTDDKTLVMRAVTKENVPEVVGRFGLGNLGMLQGLMNLKTYSTESTSITVNAKDGVVKSLAFASDEASTNFIVQSEKFIPPQPRFTEQPYDVTIVPSATKVQELKSFSGVFKSFSALVTPYTEQDTLYFHVGEKNKSNHSGSLQFSKTDGELKLQYGYSIDRVLQALNRVSNAESATLGITKTGMLNVTIDTGIAVYQIFVTGC